MTGSFVQETFKKLIVNINVLVFGLQILFKSVVYRPAFSFYLFCLIYSVACLQNTDFNSVNCTCEVLV